MVFGQILYGVVEEVPEYGPERCAVGTDDGRSTPRELYLISARLRFPLEFFDDPGRECCGIEFLEAEAHGAGFHASEGDGGFVNFAWAYYRCAERTLTHEVDADQPVFAIEHQDVELLAVRIGIELFTSKVECIEGIAEAFPATLKRSIADEGQALAGDSVGFCRFLLWILVVVHRCMLLLG
jgi:hypothetical protein